MLGYLILIALQIILGFLGKDIIHGHIPKLGAYVDPLVNAAVLAVIVWVVGVLASFVVKDVRRPGSATLVSTLVGALIGAAVIVFLPRFGLSIPAEINSEFIPVAGAILGYLVRR